MDQRGNIIHAVFAILLLGCRITLVSSCECPIVYIVKHQVFSNKSGEFDVNLISKLHCDGEIHIYEKATIVR